MDQFVSSVSTKGQVTLPAEIRTKLGIKARDKMVIVLEEGGIVMKPAKSGLRAYHQVFVPKVRGLTDREMTDIAAEETAGRFAREGLDDD